MAKGGRTKDYERGERIQAMLWGPSTAKASRLQKDLLDITAEHLFGRIWARPALKLRDRSMITVATLTALGRERQLRSHIRGALKLGITRKEIEELMIHLAHYAGWPAGFTGIAIAEEVFREADTRRPDRAPKPTRRKR